MYNMNISILGYTISVEILILIGVIYLILLGHTVCGCCNMSGIMEGLETLTSNATTSTPPATPAVGVGANPAAVAKRQAERQQIKQNIEERQQIRKNIKARAAVAASAAPVAPTTPATSATTTTTTEGFVGANTNYGESSSYSLTNYKPVNTSSWNSPNMTVVKGQPLSSAVKSILNRPSQPVPLPNGEMLMFANTEFKPECCPNSYSTSTGCACMTTEQYNYLVLRGGNNVPYSEY